MDTLLQSCTVLGKLDRGTEDWCLMMVLVLPGVLKLGIMWGVVGWDPPALTLLRHSVLELSTLESLALSHLGL